MGAGLVSVGALEEVVENLVSQFNAPIPIFINDRDSDVIPASARPDGYVASGVVYGGKIHLFREGIANVG
jgi:hypothetical protein